MQNVDSSIRELDVARYNTLGVLTSTDHRIGIQYIFDTFGRPVNLDDGKSAETDKVYNKIVDLISIHIDIEKLKKSTRKKTDPSKYEKCVGQLLESIVTPANLKYVEIALAVAVNYGSQYLVRDIFNTLDEKKLKIDLNSYNFLRIGCYPHYKDDKRNRDFEKCAKILLQRGCDPDSSERKRFKPVNKNTKAPLKRFVRDEMLFCLLESTSPTMSFREILKGSLRIQNFPALHPKTVNKSVEQTIPIQPKASSSLHTIPAWTNGKVTIEILKNVANVRVNISGYSLERM